MNSEDISKKKRGRPKGHGSQVLARGGSMFAPSGSHKKRSRGRSYVRLSNWCSTLMKRHNGRFSDSPDLS